MSDLGQAVSTVVDVMSLREIGDLLQRGEIAIHREDSERCLQIADRETVLVVAEPERAALGEALLAGTLGAAAGAVLAILPPNPAGGTEPPTPVAAALHAADVFIAPCLPSLSHTTAQARERGGGATMPGVGPSCSHG